MHLYLIILRKKVKLSLSLNKHNAKKAQVGVQVNSTILDIILHSHRCETLKFCPGIR